MEVRNLCVLSWNSNSLQKRSTDVHAYVLENNIDVITLQEVGMKTDCLTLRGYQRFELSADLRTNTRGLVTYVKSCIPATLHSAYKVNGTEVLCVNVRVKDCVVIIVNTYIHANMLRSEDLPDCVFSDKSLLVGDLNARHRSLGSFFGSQNSNVLLCVTFLKPLGMCRYWGMVNLLMSKVADLIMLFF